MSDDEELPTFADLERSALEYGFHVEDIDACPIQGVMISFSRPTRRGETFLGLPVAGPRVQQEVIERHFCAGEVDDGRMAITLGRACQHVIWAMEAHGR